MQMGNNKFKTETNWQKFHKWETEYEIKRLRKLTPLDRIKILEDMYRYVLKIKRSKQLINSKKKS